MEQHPQAALNLNLPCDHQAPAAVRQAMGSLSAVGPTLGDAMLVASELVSNAVRHSDCTAHDVIDVAVCRFDHHLLITVQDPGASGREARIPPLPECAAAGLGLRIVEELTSRWGSERDGGHVVWAEVPLPPAPEAAGHSVAGPR